MREILFRGKDVETGEWRYGSFLELPDGWTTTYWGRYTRDHRFFIIVIENNESKRFEIDHNTVGQYTGLRDKNGVKIFEGDIVKWTLKRGFIVPGFTYETDYFSRVFNYNPGEISEDTTFTSFVFFCKQNGAWMLQTDKDSKAFLTGEINRNLLGEVIGNIHDNPELLECSND